MKTAIRTLFSACTERPFLDPGIEWMAKQATGRVLNAGSDLRELCSRWYLRPLTIVINPLFLLLQRIPLDVPSCRSANLVIARKPLS